jgi:aspartyl-tRNA(Asn)/glutamyl-tRNA(Gln) amidotransferase subunit B
MSTVYDKYDPVLGIEIHIELNTKTKMFCACRNSFGAMPNANTCPVCLGFPGSLPVVNKEAVKSAVKLGLALNAKISKNSFFARKNYFYPDLAKNYQISQSDEPIVQNGYLEVPVTINNVTNFVKIDIERAHMEEDAAKNTHIGGIDGRIADSKYSLIDYNRGGVPLIEIVTDPIKNTGKNAAIIAKNYVQTMRDYVVALGISNAKMQEGSLRADINISLRKKTADTSKQDNIPFGTRTETKNINSFKAIEKAVQYEIERQAKVLDSGNAIIQETRHFINNKTVSGRPKANADNYRYFSEPDLTLIIPSDKFIESLKKQIPESPAKHKLNLQKKWNFTDLEMQDIINADLVNTIENAVKIGIAPNKAKKWYLGEISKIANRLSKNISELSIKPEHILEIEELIKNKKINDNIAREIVEKIIETQNSIKKIIADNNLIIKENTDELKNIVIKVLYNNKDVVKKLNSGKLNVIGVLIGGVMKETKGKANPAEIQKLIMQLKNNAL